MPSRFSTLFRLSTSAVEPVTLAELKAQLKLLHTDDDTELTTFGIQAREWVEEFVNSSLFYTDWMAKFEGWPEDRLLVLPRPPLSVVTNVAYRDSDGVLVDLSEDTDYVVDADDGSILFRQAFAWPSVSLDYRHPVEVEFRAGYGTAVADLPLRFGQAIRLCVSSNYGKDRGNDRSGVSFRAPSVAERLLNPNRVRPV